MVIVILSFLLHIPIVVAIGLTSWRWRIIIVSWWWRWRVGSYTSGSLIAINDNIFVLRATIPCLSSADLNSFL
jgi:hypothetical protein